MEIKPYVVSRVRFEDYYKKRFPEWNPDFRQNVRCPFHDDGEKPNLSIGLMNGGAKCHSANCGKSIGNIVHFESERLGIGEDLAALRIYNEFVRPIIKESLVFKFMQQLANRPAYIGKILKSMGIGPATIKKFRLGYCIKRQRLTIPVYNRFNLCVNIRFYKPPFARTSIDEAKIYNYAKDDNKYGRPELFGLRQLDCNKDIFIFAGERDAILANQDGYNAIASTHGEGSYESEWDYIFEGRNVYIVYDTDKAGISAANQLSQRLDPIAAKVKVIRLPLRNPLHKDYSDWRLKEKAKPEALRQFRMETALPKVEGISEGEVESDGIKTPPLHSQDVFEIAELASNPTLLNKKVKTRGIVSAKAGRSFYIPWRFRVSSAAKKPFIYSLPIGRELMNFVNASDNSILQQLQGILGSTSMVAEPIEHISGIEVEIIPTAAIDTTAAYTVQRCFFFGKSIEANVPYEFEIIPTSTILRQETVGIIAKATALSRTVDAFSFTPENYADLSVFQGQDSVWATLLQMGDYLSRHITHVHNRLDWNIAAFLTWCSPIGFRLPGDAETQRGWINTLALGDTETGKSKVVKALKKTFGCGSFISGECCTFVGLVGGLVKSGSGQLMLRWGHIPLQDRQLVILEEMSGLSVHDISNMSDIRSSGVARIDKGGISSETTARTRLICLSNVRHKKINLSGHLFGVHAVQDLIGHGEDIARFDMILTLIDREVSVDLINSVQLATVANDDMIGQDQFRKLVQMIWALTPEQIQFTQKAYERILEATKKLSSEFHSGIPIFKGGSGRYKIARLACAIACSQFAWNGTHIVVNVNHVNAAVKFLYMLYDKPSLGYRQYSQQMIERDTVGDPIAVRHAIKTYFNIRHLQTIIETLIHSTRFSRDELMAIASLAFTQADSVIGCFIRNRVIRKGEGNSWEITPAGKQFLENNYGRAARTNKEK